MTTEHFETEIQAWDPDGSDLPDQIVLHLDDCEACSALFNARFEQWQEPEPIVPPPDAMSRVMPATVPANNTWGYGGAVGLVAALLLGTVLLPVGVIGSIALVNSEEEAAHPTPRTHLPNYHTPKRRKPAQDTAVPAAELPPPPPPVRRAPRKRAGGAGARQPAPTPGTIHITITGQTFLAAEIKCPGGIRKRAAFTGNTAIIQGIPGGESCEVLFKGALPAKFKGVESGRAYRCTFQGSTVICK